MTILKGVALWAVVGIYGVFDELTQGFVPRRTPDLKDWIADAIGAAIGLSLFALLGVLVRRRRQLKLTSKS
jgi:VanZ family protein